jgi:flagellar basal body P-ring formation protein FlgA
MLKRFQSSVPIIAASFFIFYGVIISAAAFASDRIQLTFKPTVVVDQEEVRLADIASISGDQKAGSLPVEKVVVAKAPLPGQTRFLSLDYIRIRLKQAGFQTDAMSFNGAQDVQISRNAAILSQDAITHAVEAAIRRQMPWKREAVIISNIHFNDDIKLPTGTLTHRIVPNRDEDYLGRTMLALHLFVDGELVKKTWVHADISVMADVVKVVRPLGKHQPIEREDLAVVRADLADLSADTVRRVEEALGNQTTQMIYPDTVLKRGMFSLPPLVRRGDIVKIVANAGPMTITATGKVKQKGCKGEMVHVINTDSNRVIIARVIGPGAVEVDF